MNILTHLMLPPYTPGSDIKVIQTRFGVFGLLVCADSFVEEYRLQMAALKPDLVLIPYGWAAPENDWPEHLKNLQETVTQAAKDIDAPVVGTDLVGEITHGPWAGWTYGGGSIAVDPRGKILALAKDRDRDIKTFTLSIGDP
jgi:predicted amidohydrolase